MDNPPTDQQHLASALKNLQGTRKKGVASGVGSGSGKHPEGGSKTPVETVVAVEEEEVVETQPHPQKRPRNGESGLEKGDEDVEDIRTPKSVKGKGKEEIDDDVYHMVEVISELPTDADWDRMGKQG